MLLECAQHVVAQHQVATVREEVELLRRRGHGANVPQGPAGCGARRQGANIGPQDERSRMACDDGSKAASSFISDTSQTRRAGLAAPRGVKGLHRRRIQREAICSAPARLHYAQARLIFFFDAAQSRRYRLIRL